MIKRIFCTRIFRSPTRYSGQKKSPNYRQNVLGDKEDVNGVASNLGHAEEDIQETSDEHRLGNIMNGHFQYYIVLDTDDEDKMHFFLIMVIKRKPTFEAQAPPAS